MFDFGEAINRLKAGKRVAREGWNGKGMWLALQVPDAHSKMGLPYIYMRTAGGPLVPWLASQTDVLSEDWHEIELSDAPEEKHRMDSDTTAQIAFAAYNESAGGKTWDGKPIPTWEQLSESEGGRKVQGHWRAAMRAAFELKR